MDVKVRHSAAIAQRMVVHMAEASATTIITRSRLLAAIPSHPSRTVCVHINVAAYGFSFVGGPCWMDYGIYGRFGIRHLYASVQVRCYERQPSFLEIWSSWPTIYPCQYTSCR